MWAHALAALVFSSAVQPAVGKYSDSWPTPDEAWKVKVINWKLAWCRTDLGADCDDDSNYESTVQANIASQGKVLSKAPFQMEADKTYRFDTTELANTDMDSTRQYRFANIPSDPYNSGCSLLAADNLGDTRTGDQDFLYLVDVNVPSGPGSGWALQQLTTPSNPGTNEGSIALCHGMNAMSEVSDFGNVYIEILAGTGSGSDSTTTTAEPTTTTAEPTTTTAEPTTTTEPPTTTTAEPTTSTTDPPTTTTGTPTSTNTTCAQASGDTCINHSEFVLTTPGFGDLKVVRAYHDDHTWHNSKPTVVSNRDLEAFFFPDLMFLCDLGASAESFAFDQLQWKQRSCINGQQQAWRQGYCSVYTDDSDLPGADKPGYLVLTAPQLINATACN